jgi:predicted TIM-barrel fold metal-dependent hydrolase
VEALEQAHRILDEVTDRVLADVPAGAVLFDAHTHLGDDIDGMRGRPDEMLAMFDRVGITGSFTFCLDEPDRAPAFSAANDRTLAYAAETPDRIIPFVRLDLTDGPIDEANRCLDRGARGIKLHPRAQGFSTTSSRSRSSATSRS